jgi:hypothetical protein
LSFEGIYQLEANVASLEFELMSAKQKLKKKDYMFL